MKKKLLYLIVMIMVTSCVSVTKFPTSNIAPAADITVKKKKDKNNNYTITVIAENLASANRLQPPKNSYVVWIVTEDDGVKNIGQLNQKNAQKAVLVTVSAFNPKEIFITGEDEGNSSFPGGLVISRTKL